MDAVGARLGDVLGHGWTARAELRRDLRVEEAPADMRVQLPRVFGLLPRLRRIELLRAHVGQHDVGIGAGSRLHETAVSL